MQSKGPEGGRGEQRVSHSGSEWEMPGCSLKMESVTSHKDGQLLGAGRSRKTFSPKAPKAEFHFGPGRFLLDVQPREQCRGGRYHDCREHEWVLLSSRSCQNVCFSISLTHQKAGVASVGDLGGRGRGRGAPAAKQAGLMRIRNQSREKIQGEK